MKRTQRGLLELPVLIGLGLAFAAVVAGAWFAIHAIERKGYDAGVKDEGVKTAAAIAERDQARREGAQEKALRLAAEASVGQLTGALEASSARIEELAKATTDAQARTKAALARIDTDAKRHRAEIARLQGIINGPPLTTDTAAEAEAILRELAVARTGG